MMATVRKAWKRSRNTMMRAGSMSLLAELQGALGDRGDAIGSLRQHTFLAAGVADPEDLQVVKRVGELLLLADLQRARLEVGVVELDDRAAGGADEVVVVRVAFDVRVVIVVLGEVDAPDHARLHEELEGAVDGGAGDLDRLLLHLEQELVGLEVVVSGEDLADEGDALAGEAEALGAEEMLEAVDLAFDCGHWTMAILD